MAAEVERQRLLPLLVVRLQCEAAAAARVVDQDVDAVGLRRDRVEERPDLLALTDVAGLLEAPVTELVGNGGDRCGAAPADRDGTAGVDDGPRGRCADPRSAAGHDREPACQRVGGQR